MHLMYFNICYDIFFFDKSICYDIGYDWFWYISHNIVVSDSDLIEFFLSVWAGFSERSRDGNKFVVAERPVKQGRRNYCMEAEDSIIEERKARRENATNGFFDETESSNSSSNLLDALFVDGWWLMVDGSCVITWGSAAISWPLRL